MSKLTQFVQEVKLIENRLRHTDSENKERLREIIVRIAALSAAGVKSELQQELIKICSGDAPRRDTAADAAEKGTGHQWALAHDYKVCTICQKIEVTK